VPWEQVSAEGGAVDMVGPSRGKIHPGAADDGLYQTRNPGGARSGQSTSGIGFSCGGGYHGDVFVGECMRKSYMEKLGPEGP